MKKGIIGVIIAIAALAGIYFAGSPGGTNNNSPQGEALKQKIVAQYCTPLNTSHKFDVLAFAESRDDVDNKWYGFVICKETDLNTGEEKMRVVSDAGNVTGTALTLEQAREKALTAQAAGQTYFTAGAPFNPAGALDPRRVEYRFYQVNGEPTEVEVYVVMRDANRGAKAPVTAKAAWTR